MSAPKKTILIVEDEPHIVMGLRDALEFEGFGVISAGKGRDGVQLARAENPDAVILDLMLPDINGYAVCDQEYEVGLRSLAVPVYSSSGRVVATLNLSGSAPRMSVLDMQTRFLPHLRNAAAELGIFLR